jgi:predicted GIY-YIG superfamily endonuclease
MLSQESKEKKTLKLVMFSYGRLISCKYKFIPCFIQIKGGSRRKKIALVESMNREWRESGVASLLIIT